MNRLTKRIEGIERRIEGLAARDREAVKEFKL